MQRKQRKTGIIIIAMVLALLLYSAGVLSGLYANKIVQKETEQNLTQLRAYVNILDTNLKSMQLEQSFVQTLNQREQCDYASLSINSLIDQLRRYWDQLPFRIEQYERTTKLPDDYRALKKDYTELSLRTWIIARNTKHMCNTTIMPILYFYNASCELCAQQGAQLDSLQYAVGKPAMIFTIDAASPESIISYIKVYYNITSMPAIIIDDTVYQGRVYRPEELVNT